MRCPGAGRLFSGLVVTILAPAPGESVANRILVPEQMSLSSAIDVAVTGDTLSLAPGTYERTPDPFIKEIVIEGRLPGDPPVLRRLSAGRVTLRNIHFEPDGPGGQNPILVELLDSALLSGCSFRGFASTAIEMIDEGSDHDWLTVIEDCRFLGLGIGINAKLFRDGSHIEVTDTRFETSFVGIRLTCPPRECQGGEESEPPALGPGPARVTITGTGFEFMTELAIEARNAPWAISISGCEINASPIGIRLERAGARIDHLDARGNIDTSIGIQAISSRLELLASRLYQHDIGIELTNAGGCERPAGVIGGSLDNYCRLDTNALSLTTTHPVDADYNWWGTLICTEVHQGIQGLTVGLIADASGTYIAECMTPVLPSTWSRIKVRFAP